MNVCRKASIGRLGLGLGTAAQIVAELAHLQVQKGRIPPTLPSPVSTAVVCLGYPSRSSGSPHPIQRWRVKVAVDTFNAHQAQRLVFCGGPVRNPYPEAEVMADLARAAGVPDHHILTETNSASTWGNVMHAARATAGAARVIIVSDPLHAARARRYWLHQRPDDVDRVYITDQVGFGDGWWMKVPSAALEALRFAQERFRSSADPT